MSDEVVVMLAVAVLLPPAVVPPLLSLVAPVVTVTVTAPEVVGVPVTGQDDARAGGDGGRRGRHAGADGQTGGQAGDGARRGGGGRRGGRTVGAEDGAGVGDADAGGRRQRRTDRAPCRTPVTVMAAVAGLLPPVVVPPLVSLVAPVVTVTVTAPDVVGVPDTGQEMVRRRRRWRVGQACRRRR